MSHTVTYGDTTVAFDADFEAATVVIDDQRIALGSVNAVFVDRMDQPGQRSLTQHQIEPQVPLGVDPHLVLARRSNEMLAYLQCEIPMPAPPRMVPRLRIVTVCEKLRTP